MMIGKMNKQIRSRTWKYFWKQKWKEISQVLLVLFVIWSIVGVVFQLGWSSKCWWEDSVCGEFKEFLFPIWMMISGLITTGIWIIIGLVCWVRTNWKDASRKAKKDFKKHGR